MSERTEDFNNYLWIIRNALKDYQDIDDDDFLIVDQNMETSVNNSSTG